MRRPKKRSSVISRFPLADPGQSRSSRRPALNTKNRIAIRALTIFLRGERKACARLECRRSEMAGSGRCAGLMTTFPALGRRGDHKDLLREGPLVARSLRSAYGRFRALTARWGPI